MKKICCLILANYCFSSEIILDKINVTAQENKKSFNSSTFLNKKNINLITSKDSFITELLKTNSNVNFSKKARSSTESGEISPKDVSINGAAYWQNNFLVDNLNFNDDINPTGYRTLFKNVWKGGALSSQAINLPTDMLDNVEVMDSSVSAKYGDFQGGVVKAKTRDPRRGFHGITSFSYTSGDWQKTFIDQNVKDNYNTMRGWYDKSDFSKRKYRIGVEGYVSENFGLLFDYTKNNSIIKTKTKSTILDEKFASFPNEKRDAQNYFLKAVTNLNDTIIKPSFLYSVQNSRSFIEDDLNSAMNNIFGGYALNLETNTEFNNFFIEQNLNYSKFESSRYFDFKDGLYLYNKSNLKNWGAGEKSYYGGLGDIIQNQKTLNYKFDLNFNEIEKVDITHKFKTGFEYTNKSGSYETKTPVAEYGDAKELPDNYKCKSNDLTCVNDDSFGGKGQFLTTLWYYGDAKEKATINQIAIYLEDEIEYSHLKIRPGARIQKDSLTKHLNIAPRFASEFNLFSNDFIGFGLNRYYGRNIFAQKIYNNIFINQKSFERKHPDEKWKQIGSNTNTYFTTRLKLPYDDELSLFYRGEIKNLAYSLKYINRKGKDEIVAINNEKAGFKPKEGFDSKYYIYSNDGKTNADIYTFSFENLAPFHIFGFGNNAKFSFTYMNKKSNFTDFSDKDVDEKVIYNGKFVSIYDLPVVDYYFKKSFNFSHNIKISDFTISNFISYKDKTKTLISKWQQINGKFYRSYSSVNIPSHTTWDVRINYSKNLYKNVNFFTNLDINNILNKKYIVEKYETYNVFDPGTNVWFEVGLKW